VQTPFLRTGYAQPRLQQRPGLGLRQPALQLKPLFIALPSLQSKPQVGTGLPQHLVQVQQLCAPQAPCVVTQLGLLLHLGILQLRSGQGNGPGLPVMLSLQLLVLALPRGQLRL
jgi:hypothetical protein